MRTEKLKWYIALVFCLCNLNFMLLAQNLDLISAPINVNAISTKIYNTGNLFWHPQDNNFGFFVPFQGKESAFSILSSNLLLLINNEKEGIQLAGESYIPNFKPGPLFDQHFILIVYI